MKRALLSVYDKTGIVELAQVLKDKGIEIISTGGTAKALKEAGIETIELGDYTGFPEMLDGRVKTLHPKIHGGLLYIRGNKEHEKTVAEHGIGPIDLVVSNLYPFEKTVAKPGVTDAEVIENIDIGGPSMIRSASKNHAFVTVVVDPSDYEMVIPAIRDDGGTTLEMRRSLAGKAYARTAAYDAAIASYFEGTEDAPENLAFSVKRVQALRYGENPHQKAALYGNWNEYYKQLQGKELSYNNILDLTAAAELISEFNGDAPTIAILKHMNPCGVGQGATLLEAWMKAFETDKQAPFGGIIASNIELDGETAGVIKEIFCEVIVAPSFSKEALSILGEKKNLRLMQILKNPSSGNPWRVRSVGAESVVLQEADLESVEAADLKIVTKRPPTDEELKAMLFGWKIVKHVKSNAIVYSGPDRTLSIGAGQMSRVDSSRIAVWKAGEAKLSLKGSTVASDAFFPFPDALLAAADAGATAVIQPGGSVNDPAVIAAADERGMAMAFTGVRHFKH
ncbi:bifunctional phosphoribosylaminoimidazolecarboxamide formyltransferase/IMP cyclohydrolase [Candidatus Kaiserbacteria bacterium]|nr:bifunctional phosphoribosylaminoimidazolecarboxamide formyltransferase/IMP cyclohydrolase [Candidatus Kaiserbacteria bacterium]